MYAQTTPHIHTKMQVCVYLYSHVVLIAFEHFRFCQLPTVKGCGVVVNEDRKQVKGWRDKIGGWRPPVWLWLKP